MSSRTMLLLILVGVCCALGCDSGSGSWVAADTAAGPDVGSEGGEDAVPEVVAPGEVCCEHADGLDVMSQEGCVELEGVGHDAAACKEICCQVDAQTYAPLVGLECTENGGIVQPHLALCKEICCEIDGGVGAMAQGLCVDVLGGEVIGASEDCEMICCALPDDQFQSVPAYMCEEDGGTPAEDDSFCD